VVMNLPDIGRAPLGVASSDHGQLLTQVSQLFNITLAAAFKLQQRRFGGKVTLIDAFNFIDGVIANFRTYGFRVSTAGAGCNLAAQVQKASKLGLSNPSLFASSLFCSPSTYTTIAADYSFMFADMVHPTTHLNALFALFVEQQIAPNIW
jgi:phospholipase/lecithinase/hemolysin